MIGEYSCPFLCNTGKACNNPCIRPEGCRFHWKAKKRVPCSDCGKPTSSTCGRCPLHVRGYYVTQYYKRQKGTYEQIMDTLAILNITLCRGCLLPIKMGEEEYCDECVPPSFGQDLSANKAEEAEEQLEGSCKTLLEQKENNVRHTDEIYDDFGLFD